MFVPPYVAKLSLCLQAQPDWFVLKQVHRNKFEKQKLIKVINNDKIIFNNNNNNINVNITMIIHVVVVNIDLDVIAIYKYF